MATKEQIIESIGRMPVTQFVELIEEMKKRFDIVIAQPTQQVSAPSIETPKDNKQEEFSVILVSAGDKKLVVIKEVREFTKLSLLESKTLVDKAPSTIKTGLSETEAQEFQKKLQDAGADVDIK